MAHVQIHREDLTLAAPTLVEGLPGVGLVGKIVADHLIEHFGMIHYGSLHCEGLPEVAVYHAGESDVKAPVRLYADADRDLLVLTSDVPVSPSSAGEFASCVTGWNADNDVRPVYLSGLPAEKDDGPELSAIATGNGDERLATADLDAPSQHGAVTGPTGALLYESERRGLDSVGLVVEADPKFPDPEAARVVLVDGVEPLTGLSVDTDSLVEQAEEIGQAKAELAQRMQAANEESTSARPLGMYQ